MQLFRGPSKKWEPPQSRICIRPGRNMAYEFTLINTAQDWATYKVRKVARLKSDKADLIRLLEEMDAGVYFNPGVLEARAHRLGTTVDNLRVVASRLLSELPELLRLAEADVEGWKILHPECFTEPEP
jgi:hypothetical protein